MFQRIKRLKPTSKVALLTLLLLAIITPITFAAIGDQLNKIVANTQQQNDKLGQALAIDERHVIAGTVQRDNPGPLSDTGGAIVFDVVTGNQTHELYASDGDSDDFFGYAVDIHKDTAIVGAFKDDDNGTDAGAAYLFNIQTGQEIKLLAPATYARNFDGFGVAVAVEGNRAVVGSNTAEPDPTTTDSGAAYVYDANNGSFLYILAPNDLAFRDHFGTSVDVDSGLIIVGSDDADTVSGGTDAGKAYIFDADQGGLLATLVAQDGAPNDYFGTHVAISGNYAVVSSPGEKNASGQAIGAVYIFDANTGSQLHKITNPESETGSFGSSVAINNDIVIIGVSSDNDNGTGSGSAYLYNASTGSMITKLLADDGDTGDQLGYDVAISHYYAVASSPNDSSSDYGALYAFEVVFPLGDFDLDEDVDADDIDLLFLEDGTTSPPTPDIYDLDSDGVIETEPNNPISDMDILIRVILNTEYGDLNLDGQVGPADLATLKLNWLQTGKGWADGDLNGDGTVGPADLALLKLYWLFGVE